MSKINREKILKPFLVTGQAIKSWYQRRLSRQTRLALLIITGGVMCSVAVVATTPKPAPEEVAEKAWSVSAMAVVPMNIAPNLNLFGRVSTPRKAKLTAAVQANVLDVLVDEGQLVAKGDLLIQLDDRDVKLDLMQAQADLDDAQAQRAQMKAQHQADVKKLDYQEQMFDLAQKKTERYQQLRGDQLISAAVLDEAESLARQQAIALEQQRVVVKTFKHELAKAKASVDRATVKVEQARLNLERTRIEAPFGGLVSGVEVAPGDRVSVGHALLALIDTKKMEVRAPIASKYIASLSAQMKQQQRVRAWATIDGERIALTLRHLAAEVVSGHSGIDGIFAIDDKDLAASKANVVVLGRVVNMSLELPAEQNVASVPVQAVYDNQRVYLVENERLRGVDVDVVGEYVNDSGDYRVLVRSEALQEGQSLMTTQLSRAMTGLKVALSDASDQAEALDEAAVAVN